MAQVVDTKGKTRATSSGKVMKGSKKGDASSLREDLARSTGINTGTPKGYENALANTLERTTRPVSKPRVSSSGGVSNSGGRRTSYNGISGGSPVIDSQPTSMGWSPINTSMNKLGGKKGKSTSSFSSWFDKDHDEEQAKINESYENAFKASGMDDNILNSIHSRGGFMDVARNNPATQAAVDDFGSNPWLDVDANELSIPDSYNTVDENSPFVSKLLNAADDGFRFLRDSMFDESGNYKSPKIPKEYRVNDSNTPGDVFGAIDDGKTYDYEHLTADRITGDAMQKYVEMGMGGRPWWEYDPYRTYLKSDEMMNYDYHPYLPDQRSMANMVFANALDSPSDIAGTIADLRVNNTPSYSILYDVDHDPKTTDDIIKLPGRDFNYRDTAYYDNIGKLVAENPDIFTKRPENDEIHGAPVTTSILENTVKDINGDIKYAYGYLNSVDPSDDYSSYIVPLADGSTMSVPRNEFGYDENGKLIDLPDWLSYDDVDWSEDREWLPSDDWSYYRIGYSDGSTIDVPRDEYDSWFKKNGEANPKKYPAKYVSVDKASGDVPDNLDSLNDWYRENMADSDTNWTDYPVQYVPDLVMDDGTRVTYPQFYDIYFDEDRVDKDSGDFAGSNVAYEYNLMNKPRFLMKNGGQLFNEDLSPNLDDFIPGSIDMTLGSLPISFEKIAWPLSVTQALSKSINGLNPGGYDSLTDSDMYMSGEIDKNTGEFVPTANDVDKIASAMGTSLVPLTENIAGNVSGRSFIPALSGDVPVNPTLRQLGKAWFLGNLGEGIEEIPGNVFDELMTYADKAYGTPIDPETGEPLMTRNTPFGPLVPVRDENGEYKFVNDNTGEPITEVHDSMNHVYKDSNTKMSDRVANFINNYSDIANALAGGYSVGGWMSLPNIAAVPGAIRNTNYRKKMNLPQYVAPKENEEVQVDIDDINRYLGITE